MQFCINPFTHKLDAFEQDLPGGGDVEFLVGDTGGQVPANAAHAINILGGPGIDVTGNIATSTLTISVNGGIEGTGQTVDAATADIVSIPLGAVPGMYLVSADIVGYDAINSQGVAYELVGGIRTTGLAGVEFRNQTTDDFEEGALSACDVDLLPVANAMVVRVTGVVGRTINWRVVVYYTFRS